MICKILILFIYFISYCKRAPAYLTRTQVHLPHFRCSMLNGSSGVVLGHFHDSNISEVRTDKSVKSQEVMSCCPCYKICEFPLLGLSFCLIPLLEEPRISRPQDDSISRHELSKSSSAVPEPIFEPTLFTLQGNKLLPSNGFCRLCIPRKKN